MFDATEVYRALEKSGTSCYQSVPMGGRIAFYLTNFNEDIKDQIADRLTELGITFQFVTCSSEYAPEIKRNCVVV